MKFIVNGTAVTPSPDWHDRMLLDFLREELRLTGSKKGCNKGLCGTCTVLIDQKAKLACKTKVSSLEGKKVVTIEGFAPGPDELHPLQQAFIDEGAVQCGFCTPGMILRAHHVLKQNPKATEEEIKKGISTNLCRCTGYQQIVNAVRAASDFYLEDNKRKKHK